MLGRAERLCASHLVGVVEVDPEFPVVTAYHAHSCAAPAVLDIVGDGLLE